MYKTISIIFIIGISVTIAAKYPSNLNMCHYGEVKCIQDTITHIIQTYPNGLPSIGMPVVEPLHIDALEILQSNDSPVAVDLKFKNLDLGGISKATVTKVVGFTRDVRTSKFEVYARVPKLSVTGDYSINGRVLVIPITGNGKAVLDFHNVDITFKYKPRVVVKKGKEHVQTEKFDLDFETAKLSINLGNLFNGDKALGDNMNAFLNENWKDILSELKPVIVQAVEQILGSIVNRIFGKFPYAEVFLDD